jgi:hypothetical protein
MTQPSNGDKFPLTLQLSADLAARLKLAADARKRPAADLVVELLDRHLPHPPPAGKPGNIPYA